MKVYVLTLEPYHDNSIIVAAYSSLESAKENALRDSEDHRFLIAPDEFEIIWKVGEEKYGSGHPYWCDNAMNYRITELEIK